MKTYNGHPSYNHWNVALWFGNDEGLYRMALEAKRTSRNIRQAAVHLRETLEQCGIDKTPDGVPYRVSYIRHAISDL